MKAGSSKSYLSRLDRIQYPEIESVLEGVDRPLWSVMIPTYNGTKYLEQTLRSVLDQDPGVDHMQIEVIDDCSTSDDPETLVKEIGQGRISFFRQPQNVGQIENWNTCIQRACGYWVQTLHQDDIVTPGFYRCLQLGIDAAPDIGAAFCRHRYIDEHNENLFLSLLEQENPGILANWLMLIGVMQRVQFPSIVIKRSTFEKLGGFCPQARSVADWEMWKRIAVHYPIWYEPQVLACFRLHSASESSRLIQTGTNVADTRRAIAISNSYLPSSIASTITRQAHEYYAIDAIDRARNLINQGNSPAAFNQIREALKCSCSLSVMRSLARLLKNNGEQLLFNIYQSKFSH